MDCQRFRSGRLERPAAVEDDRVSLRHDDPSGLSGGHPPREATLPKAEALSGIVASLALLAAAAMIAVQSIREILTPHHLPHWSTLVVLVVVDGQATVQQGHDIGGRVRSVLSRSPLRIADAFIHIEPTRIDA